MKVTCHCCHNFPGGKEHSSPKDAGAQDLSGFPGDSKPCTHPKVLCFSTSLRVEEGKECGQQERSLSGRGAEGEKGAQRDGGRTVMGGDGKYSRRGGSGETSLPSTATRREVAVRWGQVSCHI